MVKEIFEEISEYIKTCIELTIEFLSHHHCEEIDLVLRYGEIYANKDNENSLINFNVSKNFNNCLCYQDLIFYFILPDTTIKISHLINEDCRQLLTSEFKNLTNHMIEHEFNERLKRGCYMLCKIPDCEKFSQYGNPLFGHHFCAQHAAKRSKQINQILNDDWLESKKNYQLYRDENRNRTENVYQSIVKRTMYTYNSILNCSERTYLINRILVHERKLEEMEKFKKSYSFAEPILHNTLLKKFKLYYLQAEIYFWWPFDLYTQIKHGIKKNYPFHCIECNQKVYHYRPIEDSCIRICNKCFSTSIFNKKIIESSCEIIIPTSHTNIWSKNQNLLTKIYIAQKSEQYLQINISSLMDKLKNPKKHYDNINKNYVSSISKLKPSLNFTNTLNELKIYNLLCVDTTIINWKKNLNVLKRICSYRLHEKLDTNSRIYYNLKHIKLPKILIKCFENQQIKHFDIKIKTILLKIPYIKSLIILNKPQILDNVYYITVSWDVIKELLYLDNFKLNTKRVWYTEITGIIPKKNVNFKTLKTIYFNSTYVDRYRHFVNFHWKKYVVKAAWEKDKKHPDFTNLWNLRARPECKYTNFYYIITYRHISTLKRLKAFFDYTIIKCNKNSFNIYNIKTCPIWWHIDDINLNLNNKITVKKEYPVLRIQQNLIYKFKNAKRTQHLMMEREIFPTTPLKLPIIKNIFLPHTKNLILLSKPSIFTKISHNLISFDVHLLFLESNGLKFSKLRSEIITLISMYGKNYNSYMKKYLIYTQSFKFIKIKLAKIPYINNLTLRNKIFVSINQNYTLIYPDVILDFIFYRNLKSLQTSTLYDFRTMFTLSEKILMIWKHKHTNVDLRFIYSKFINVFGQLPYLINIKLIEKFYVNNFLFKSNFNINKTTIKKILSLNKITHISEIKKFKKTFHFYYLNFNQTLNLNILKLLKILYIDYLVIGNKFYSLDKLNWKIFFQFKNFQHIQIKKLLTLDKIKLIKTCFTKNSFNLSNELNWKILFQNKNYYNLKSLKKIPKHDIFNYTKFVKLKWTHFNQSLYVKNFKLIETFYIKNKFYLINKINWKIFFQYENCINSKFIKNLQYLNIKQIYNIFEKTFKQPITSNNIKLLKSIQIRKLLFKDKFYVFNKINWKIFSPNKFHYIFKTKKTNCCVLNQTIIISKKIHKNYYFKLETLVNISKYLNHLKFTHHVKPNQLLKVTDVKQTYFKNLICFSNLKLINSLCDKNFVINAKFYWLNKLDCKIFFKYKNYNNFRFVKKLHFYNINQLFTICKKIYKQQIFNYMIFVQSFQFDKLTSTKKICYCTWEQINCVFKKTHKNYITKYTKFVYQFKYDKSKQLNIFHNKNRLTWINNQNLWNLKHYNYFKFKREVASKNTVLYFFTTPKQQYTKNTWRIEIANPSTFFNFLKKPLKIYFKINKFTPQINTIYSTPTDFKTFINRGYVALNIRQNYLIIPWNVNIPSSQYFENRKRLITVNPKNENTWFKDIYFDKKTYYNFGTNKTRKISSFSMSNISLNGWIHNLWIISNEKKNYLNTHSNLSKFFKINNYSIKLSQSTYRQIYWTGPQPYSIILINRLNSYIWNKLLINYIKLLNTKYLKFWDPSFNYKMWREIKDQRDLPWDVQLRVQETLFKFFDVNNLSKIAFHDRGTSWFRDSYKRACYICGEWHGAMLSRGDILDDYDKYTYKLLSKNKNRHYNSIEKINSKNHRLKTNQSSISMRPVIKISVNKNHLKKIKKLNVCTKHKYFKLNWKILTWFKNDINLSWIKFIHFSNLEQELDTLVKIGKDYVYKFNHQKKTINIDIKFILKIFNNLTPKNISKPNYIFIRVKPIWQIFDKNKFDAIRLHSNIIINTQSILTLKNLISTLQLYKFNSQSSKYGISNYQNFIRLIKIFYNITLPKFLNTFENKNSNQKINYCDKLRVYSPKTTLMYTNPSWDFYKITKTGKKQQLSWIVKNLLVCTKPKWYIFTEKDMYENCLGILTKSHPNCRPVKSLYFFLKSNLIKDYLEIKTQSNKIKISKHWCKLEHWIRITPNDTKRLYNFYKDYEKLLNCFSKNSFKTYLHTTNEFFTKNYIIKTFNVSLKIDLIQKLVKQKKQLKPTMIIKQWKKLDRLTSFEIYWKSVFCFDTVLERYYDHFFIMEYSKTKTMPISHKTYWTKMFYNKNLIILTKPSTFFDLKFIKTSQNSIIHFLNFKSLKITQNSQFVCKILSPINSEETIKRIIGASKWTYEYNTQIYCEIPHNSMKILNNIIEYIYYPTTNAVVWSDRLMYLWQQSIFFLNPQTCLNELNYLINLQSKYDHLFFAFIPRTHPTIPIRTFKNNRNWNLELINSGDIIYFNYKSTAQMRRYIEAWIFLGKRAEKRNSWAGMKELIKWKTNFWFKRKVIRFLPTIDSINLFSSYQINPTKFEFLLKHSREFNFFTAFNLETTTKGWLDVLWIKTKKTIEIEKKLKNETEKKIKSLTKRIEFNNDLIFSYFLIYQVIITTALQTSKNIHFKFAYISNLYLENTYNYNKFTLYSKNVINLNLIINVFKFDKEILPFVDKTFNRKFPKEIPQRIIIEFIRPLNLWKFNLNDNDRCNLNIKMLKDAKSKTNWWDCCFVLSGLKLNPLFDFTWNLKTLHYDNNATIFIWTKNPKHNLTKTSETTLAKIWKLKKFCYKRTYYDTSLNTTLDPLVAQNLIHLNSVNRTYVYTNATKPLHIPQPNL